jgi:hypothetical protein
LENREGEALADIETLLDRQALTVGVIVDPDLVLGSIRSQGHERRTEHLASWILPARWTT